MEPSKPIRILAVDGGGVGGVIPARIIERISEVHPDLLAKADVFAGTSTGGLIALGLAMGFSPAQVCDVYRNHAGEIFSTRMRRWWFARPFRAKYRTDGLKRVLKQLVGDTRLKDLKKPIFIPVTALARADSAHVPAGVFLSTIDRLFGDVSKERYRSGEWSCFDAALATSAAPTYFPAHRAIDPKIGGEWILWDGGLVANDPALAAIVELTRFIPLPDESFRVLSLGTGYRNIHVDAGDWGPLQAALPIIATLMDVSVGSTVFYLRRLFGDRAYRATPQLKANYELDDAAAVPGLLQVADDYCDGRLAPTAGPTGDRHSLLKWLSDNW